MLGWADTVSVKLCYIMRRSVCRNATFDHRLSMSSWNAFLMQRAVLSPKRKRINRVLSGPMCAVVLVACRSECTHHAFLHDSPFPKERKNSKHYLIHNHSKWSDSFMKVWDGREKPVHWKNSIIIARRYSDSICQKKCTKYIPGNGL